MHGWVINAPPFCSSSSSLFFYLANMWPHVCQKKSTTKPSCIGQAVQVVRRVCRLMTEHNERLGAGLLRAFDDETTSGGSSIGVAVAAGRRPHGRERGWRRRSKLAAPTGAYVAPYTWHGRALLVLDKNTVNMYIRPACDHSFVYYTIIFTDTNCNVASRQAGGRRPVLSLTVV